MPDPIVSTEPSPDNSLASLLALNTEKLLTCVHCGLCLPACPTYRQLGNENDSPRGRIYLMRGVVEGRISRSDSFVSHIDLCLGCRACETVCPSGVPYGHLLEAARSEVAQAKASGLGSWSDTLLRFALTKVFTRPMLLAALLAPARWIRNCGLAEIVLRSGLMGRRLRFAAALLMASKSPLKQNNRQRSSRSSKANSIRTSVLTGCVMESLFDQTNRATENVLRRNGCEIVEAKDQACCGALHAHAGELETARSLARRNIDAFAAGGAERVIVNAAGCGAAMKEYGELLRDNPEYGERAREFSSKVRDISEFLLEIGVEPFSRSIDRRVAYDAPCHLFHAQRITQAPVDLLKKIPGLTIIPLRGSETCCGGAGIYNLQHPELSSSILNDKLASIHESGADTIVTANPGCIMQIGAGALLDGLRIDVVHPVELLDEAYESE